MVEGKRVFITGGAGFIGSHLCERLAPHNDVTVYDNLSRNALPFLPADLRDRIRLVQGDIMDADALREAMAGHELVVHCAAVAGIYAVVRRPTQTMRVNFVGTYHALEAAVANRVGRFVDFSTSEVYGPRIYDGREDDLTTQGVVGEMRWCYAVSKLAGEHLAHSYMQEHGLPVVTIRPFNIYGPRQVGEGAIHEFVQRALRNETITLYNDGTQIRAWCHVHDFIDGLVSAIAVDAAPGHVFNLGNPQGTSTNLELVHAVQRLVGSSSPIVFRRHPGPEVSIRVPSIQKAVDLLGYSPHIGLSEGIQSTIDWYREHGAV